MSRVRSPNYQKNLVKRLRRAAAENRPPPIPKCDGCEVPLKYFKIPVGNKMLCPWCDDKLTKLGYLQLDDNNRMYRDGSVREAAFQIKDVVTGRME